MVPLSITILVIYGVIGLVGKDYDMPVAVLSALTLGMAVGLCDPLPGAGPRQLRGERLVESQRRRDVRRACPGDRPQRAGHRDWVSPPPGCRAPGALQDGRIFLCAIRALSGVVTLIILPAILTVAEKRLFAVAAAPQSAKCNCAFCFVVSLASVVVVLLNAYQFGVMGFNNFMWISIIAVPALAVLCGVLSRRQACRSFEARQTKAATA
jgi:hypothetical protein